MSLLLQELQNNGLTTCTPQALALFDCVTPQEVRLELARPDAPFSILRAVRLLSPAAQGLLEPMARLSRDLTRQRFGNTIALYAPLYVSNYCCNRCLYCGFNAGHEITRSRLSVDEVVAEAKIIAAEGFSDLLLVSGEDPKFATVAYFREIAARLRGLFATLSLEIYALTRAEYAELFAAGYDGVTLYQETFDAALYPSFHPQGPKADYANRLRAIEDAAAAGMRQIGVGALLGLNHWRYEALCTLIQAQVIMHNYWRTRVSISFPRMRPASGVSPQWLRPVSDHDLTQMLLACRILFPDAGLVLSTREPAALRDNLLPLGLTRISAGSRTSPGGYGQEEPGGEQFKIADERSAAEVSAMLRARGFDPVWKDWDSSFCTPSQAVRG